MNKHFSFLQKRWFLYTFLGFAVFFTVLPIAIRFGAEYALTHYLKAQTATIEDVDLNLFTGTLAITGLEITYQNQPSLTVKKLAVNIGLLALIQQHILIQSVTVDGLFIRIYPQGDNWVVGIALPQSTEPPEEKAASPSQPSAWQFGIEQVVFNDIQVAATYQQQNHQVSIHHLDLNPLLMWQADTASALHVKAQLNGAALAIDSQLTPFSQDAAFAFNIQLDSLSLAALKPFLPKDLALDAALSLNSHLNLVLKHNGDMIVKQNGSASLALKQLTLPDINVKAQALSWQGQSDVLIKAKQQPVIQAQGQVGLTGLEAHYLPLQVATYLDRFSLDTNSSLALDNLDSSLKVKAEVQLDQWRLSDDKENIDLANFKQLNLNEIALDGLNQLSIQSIQLQQLNALQNEKQSLAQLGNITLGELGLKQLNQLDIQAISLADLAVKLRLNKDGHIDVLDNWLASLNTRLKANSTEKTPTTTVASAPPKSEPAPFQYHIHAITFTGKNTIDFTDASLKRPIVHPIQVQQLAIGAINSQQTQQLTPLDVQLKLYQHASFKLHGEITALAELNHMNGDIKANIAGIELTKLSPYIIKAIGYKAHSGQFNSDTTASIKNGQLDSQTKVNIQRIKLEPADKDVIAKVSKSLSMPVSTALKIITDSKDNLKITVPVTGDLSDPDIKISRIMAGAINQAIKNAAVTYFKYAMQPFGAIFLISQAISNAHLQARFEDVQFIPNTAQIIDKQKDYLAKVATMIKEKKDFSIIACVQVTDEDFAARTNPPQPVDGQYHWDKASRALAQQRLDFIRSTLIETYGLSAQQVQSCEPSLSKGIPRAIMGI